MQNYMRRLDFRYGFSSKIVKLLSIFVKQFVFNEF